MSVSSEKNIEEIFTPNVEKIQLYLEFIFGGTDTNHFDGMIEISQLTSSKYFPVTAVKEAAELAAEWNKQGKNVYTTAAILVPDVEARIKARAEAEGKKTGRARGEDFYACNVVWVDIDDLPAEEKDALKTKYDVAPPNYYVVTNRVDTNDKKFINTHLWWDLDKTETDKEKIETVGKGLIQHLGGDRGTHNCTRLMKIGGSVAWPKKGGRVTQMTDPRMTDWMPSHDINDMIKAYPVIEERTPTPPAPIQQSAGRLSLNKYNNEGWSKDDVMDMLNHISPDGDYMDWLSVGMALKDYGVDFNIFDNWSSAGSTYPGSSALNKKWDSFRGTGVTIGSIYYHAKQNGFEPAGSETSNNVVSTTTILQKQEVVNPKTGEIEKIYTGQPLTATSINDLDLDNIPPREFLYHDILARKFVTMIVAPPGVGKSIFTLQMAISAAAGTQWGEWSSQKNRPLNVWVYNNEEGFDELRRRVKGIIMNFKIDKSDLTKGGSFYIDSGEKRPIMIAGYDKRAVVPTIDYELLLNEVINRKIDLLVIDPFAEMHSVNENSNDEIKKVTALFRDIAFHANCSVCLVHHTVKWSAEAGNIDSARGGGAIIGVVRRAFTIAHMTEAEATKMQVPDDERRWFVRFDDAKSNITAPINVTTWFKLVSISINNGSKLYPEGDSVGILEHINIDEIATEYASEIKETTINLLSLIARTMISIGVDSIQLASLKKMLIADGFTKYKERRLHTVIVDSVNRYGQTEPIICEGFRCIMVHEEGDNKRDGYKIILQKIPI